MKNYDRIQEAFAILRITPGTPEARALVMAAHTPNAPEEAYMAGLLAAEDLRDGTRPFRVWDGTVTDSCRTHVARVSV